MKLVRTIMMKAVVQNAYGDPAAVLSVKEIPKPVPNDQQVLLKVLSTTVNTPDWAFVVGKPYLLRLGSGLFGPRKNRQLGTDVAGIVEEIGKSVATDLKVGDAVFGQADPKSASFAEYCVANPAELAKKPDSLSFDEAAACVMSGVTAYKTIQAANIQPGVTDLLINGASGGVATFAIQMAKQQGAKSVTAVCSGRNAELCLRLGADRVIDYTTTDYTAPDQNDGRYDVILDNVLNHSYKESRRVLKSTGFIIPNSIGLDRGNWCGAIPMFIFKPSKYPAVECDINRENLESVAKSVESGKVQVVVDKVFSLEEAPQAVAYMATRRARGQVVIQISKD